MLSILPVVEQRVVADVALGAGEGAGGHPAEAGHHVRQCQVRGAPRHGGVVAEKSVDR